MVIEKLHGLQATNISLNERFTMLANISVPERPINRPPRRSVSSAGFWNQNFRRNRALIQEIARQLEFQAKQSALRQRLGLPQRNFRRFNSDSNLAGLFRSNSVGNISQQSIKNRLSWRPFNGNMWRAMSFNGGGDVGRDRGRYRRRRGMQRALPGRFRGGRVAQGRVLQRFRGRGRGGAQYNRGAGPYRGGAANRRAASNRGGMQRNSQQNKPVPTKEELDAQLDQYMAGSKSALDKELDEYMKSVMDLE